MTFSYDLRVQLVSLRQFKELQILQLQIGGGIRDKKEIAEILKRREFLYCSVTRIRR